MTLRPAAASAATRGISKPMAPSVSHTPTTVRNQGAYTHCESILAGINSLGKPANRNNAASKTLTTHIAIFCPLDILAPSVRNFFLFFDNTLTHKYGITVLEKAGFFCAKSACIQQLPLSHEMPA